jgi:hypothetical protein
MLCVYELTMEASGGRAPRRAIYLWLLGMLRMLVMLSIASIWYSVHQPLPDALWLKPPSPPNILAKICQALL